MGRKNDNCQNTPISQAYFGLEGGGEGGGGGLCINVLIIKTSYVRTSLRFS